MHKETGVSHGIAKLRFSAFIIHAGPPARFIKQYSLVVIRKPENGLVGLPLAPREVGNFDRLAASGYTLLR